MSQQEQPEGNSIPFDERKLLEGFLDTVRSSRTDGRDDDEAATEAIALIHTFIMQSIVTEQLISKQKAQQLLEWHFDTVAYNAGLTTLSQCRDNNENT